MLAMCKKQLYLQRGDFKVMGLICLGAVVLAEVIVNLVMALADPEDYFMLAPFLLFLMIGFTALILSVGYWLSAFPMGLRMGATRREMVAGTLFITVAMNLFLFAFAGLDHLLEGTLGVSYWINTVGKELEFDILYAIPWWGWPLAVLACTAVGLLAGAWVLRFGRKGFWVLWALWMAACLWPSLMPDDFNIPLIGTPLWNALPWITGVIVLALCVLAVRTLLRLPVREG